jgi:hypothetical protein
VLGGTGTNRTLSITPVAAAFGLATITVSVSDSFNTNSDTLIFQVAPNLGQFFSDRFDRVNGSLIAGDGVWVYHSGANTLGEMQIVSNQVQITGAQTEDVNTPFAGNTPYTSFSPSSGAILYASFSVNFHQLPTNASTYFAHFKDDGTANFKGRVFAGTNQAAAGKFRLGVANGSATPSAVFPQDLNTNSTYRCVLSYNTGSTESRLWVEPVDERSLSVVAADPTTTVDASSFALRQSGDIGTLFFDNLRLGGAFNDVAPYLRLLTTPITNNVLRLSWPTGPSNVLQASSSLTTPVWTNVPNPITIISNMNAVTVTNTGGSNYYRLIAP